MKIYIGTTINPQFRWHLFPLLKFHFSKTGRRALETTNEYYNFLKSLVFVDSIGEAQIAVLPMSWDYYHTNAKENEALDFIYLAKKHHKPVWSFTPGDFGFTVPDYPHVTVFRLGGLRSKLPKTHKAMPPFIEDPLKKHFNSSEIIILPYTNLPEVSFCGQANSSVVNGVKEVLKTAVRNIKSNFFGRKLDPQPLISTSMLRSKLLMRLKNSTRVNTNYILRAKYRAGAKTQLMRDRTTKEFYDNLNSAAYVLCVRGAGNFSIRFYEALALGRIPVFVNTDCLLPLAHQIDWKSHTVWVEANDKNRVAALVYDFHKSHNEQSFKELQIRNRKLWSESLTLAPFFNLENPALGQ